MTVKHRPKSTLVTPHTAALGLLTKRKVEMNDNVMPPSRHKLSSFPEALITGVVQNFRKMTKITAEEVIPTSAKVTQAKAKVEVKLTKVSGIQMHSVLFSS